MTRLLTRALNYNNNYFYLYVDLGQPYLTLLIGDPGLALGRPPNRVNFKIMIITIFIFMLTRFNSDWPSRPVIRAMTHDIDIVLIRLLSKVLKL